MHIDKCKEMLYIIDVNIGGKNMEYEKTLLDLIERIIKIEKRVDELESEKMNKESKPVRGTYTDMVIDYIKNQIQKAKEQGLNNITLTSGDIQKGVGLKNRLPLVCNAMRKCMNEKSEIIFETPSGQSSTLTIKWHF